MMSTLFTIAVVGAPVPLTVSAALAHFKMYKLAFVATLTGVGAYASAVIAGIASDVHPIAVAASVAAVAFWGVIAKLDHRKWKRPETRTA